MRIVYIAGAILPSRSAHSIQVMKMSQAFVQLGHAVTLLVPSLGEDTNGTDIHSYYGVEPDFDIQQVPLHGIRGGLLLWGLNAALRSQRLGPELIYGRQLHSCFFAAVFRMPVILEVHRPLEGKVRRTLFRLLSRMQSFKGVVTNSKALAGIIQDDMPVKNVLAAPNGAEDPGYSMPPSQGSEGLSVGYIGHLYRGRGIELIVQIASATPWAQFHIIGGLETDIEYWRAHCVHLRNVILHGFVQPAEVEHLRRACDVLLAPYQRETYDDKSRDQAVYMSPLKVFEYMATGRAIICSDLPALHEILDAWETAIFCDPENADEWIAALEQLRSNSELRDRLGKKAREAFINSFTRTARARRVLELAEVHS
jgi:glycosyltransferase involved in cell wall biosynthesis